MNRKSFRLVVAYNVSDDAERALQRTLAVAHPGAELHIVAVLDDRHRRPSRLHPTRRIDYHVSDDVRLRIQERVNAIVPGDPAETAKLAVWTEWQSAPVLDAAE